MTKELLIILQKTLKKSIIKEAAYENFVDYKPQSENEELHPGGSAGILEL